MNLKRVLRQRTITQLEHLMKSNLKLLFTILLMIAALASSKPAPASSGSVGKTLASPIGDTENALKCGDNRSDLVLNAERDHVGSEKWHMSQVWDDSTPTTEVLRKSTDASVALLGLETALGAKVAAKIASKASQVGRDAACREICTEDFCTCHHHKQTACMAACKNDTISECLEAPTHCD